MAVFWITFRIHDDATYSKRYEALQEAVRLMTDRTWWTEPTSFILFQSQESIDAIATGVKAAINPRTDMALIRAAETKSARLIGAPLDDEVHKLMDYLKKV